MKLVCKVDPCNWNKHACTRIICGFQIADELNDF